jgi:hypothetical protein
VNDMMKTYKWFWISLGVLVLFFIGIIGHEARPTSSLRHIILFNEDGKKVVALMKDTDGLTALYSLLKSPSAATRAEFEAATVDGRIFQVDSGTRADVLKEVPIPGVPDLSVLRIRIVNGPRTSEEALCFSTDAQPDNSR